MDWQPIETAPKDGTRVMLTCAGYKGRTGAFCRPGEDQEIYHLARFGDNNYWYPYVPNDWTHWMPLPTPPTSEYASPDVPQPVTGTQNKAAQS